MAIVRLPFRKGANPEKIFTESRITDFITVNFDFIQIYSSVSRTFPNQKSATLVIRGDKTRMVTF